MFQKIKLINFKNHKYSVYSFGKGKICGFFGANGSGKTNILEALSLLFNTFSTFGTPLASCIGSYEKFFRICGFCDGVEYSLFYDGKTKRQKFLIQGKGVSRKKYQEHLQLKGIIFSPLEMNILYLEPRLRRAFLDGICAQIFSEYTEQEKKYAHLLLSRNKLLKSIREKRSCINDLEFWDHSFAQVAAQIYFFRNQVIYFFEENFSKITYLVNTDHTLEFCYQTKISYHTFNKTHWQEEIKQYLEKNRQRDIAIGRTMIGPHLDDFCVFITPHYVPYISGLSSQNKQKLRSTQYLSHGENKSILLGLKFLHKQCVNAFLPHQKIIFLFDDVFAELDALHIELLFREIGDAPLLFSLQNNVPLDLTLPKYMRIDI